MLSGEELFVIDVVAVFRLLEFSLEGRGLVPREVPRDECEDRLPLGLVGLSFVLRRHALEVELLLHPVQEVQALAGIEPGEVIEARVALLRFLVVAVVAVAVEQGLGGRGKLEGMGMPGRFAEGGTRPDCDDGKK